MATEYALVDVVDASGPYPQVYIAVGAGCEERTLSSFKELADKGFSPCPAGMGTAVTGYDNVHCFSMWMRHVD